MGTPSWPMPAAFRTLAHSENSPYAAIGNETGSIYGVQFHPEVHHTPKGKVILRNFLYSICKAKGLFSTRSFIERTTAMIREEVGDGQGRLRSQRRRRLIGRCRPRPQGNRLKADLRLREQRRAQEERSPGSARPFQGPASLERPIRRRGREVPGRPEGREGSREEA